MAVSMALGVHYVAVVNTPVHRNLVLLKPKATPMASVASNNPNPSSKFGAFQLPTATPTKGKAIVACAGSSTIATPTIETISFAAQNGTTSGDTPTQTQTTITFVNNTGSDLTLKGHKIWNGNKSTADIPATIGASVDYTHTDDDSNTGSVGGLVYLLDGLVYWVVSWRNTTGSTNNKVYTDIITVDDDTVVTDPNTFWAGIYRNLMKKSNSSSKDDPDLGYSSHLIITSGNTPTLSAAFSNYY